MGRHGLKGNYGPYLEMIDKKIKEDYAPETLLEFKVSKSFAKRDDNTWSYWGYSPAANLLAKYAPKVGMPSYFFKKFSDFGSNLYENYLDHYVYYDYDENNKYMVDNVYIDKDNPPHFEKRTDPYRNFERVNIFKDEEEGYKRTFIDSPTLGYNFKDLIPYFKWKYRTEKMYDNDEESEYISFKDLQSLINKTFKSYVYLDTNWFSGRQDYFRCNKIIFDNNRIAWGPNSGLFWENSDNLGNPSGPTDVTKHVYIHKNYILKRYLDSLSGFRVLLPIGNLFFRIYDRRDDHKRQSQIQYIDVEVEFPLGNVPVPRAKGLIFQVKPTVDLEWEMEFLHSLPEWSETRSNSHLHDMFESCHNNDKIAEIIGRSYHYGDENYIDEVRNGYDDLTPKELNKLKEAIKNKEIFLSPFSLTYCSNAIIGELQKFGPEIFCKFFNIIKV